MKPHSIAWPFGRRPRSSARSLRGRRTSGTGLQLLGRSVLGILALTVTLLLVSVVVIGGLLLLLNLLFTLGLATSGIGE